MIIFLALASLFPSVEAISKTFLLISHTTPDNKLLLDSYDAAAKPASLIPMINGFKSISTSLSSSDNMFLKCFLQPEGIRLLKCLVFQT